MLPSNQTSLDALETSEASEPSQPSRPLQLEREQQRQPFRHSGWQRQRQRVRNALELLRKSARRIAAFDSCGETRWVFKHKTESGRFKIGTDHCHDRFCVPCANERAGRIAAKLKAKIADQQHRFVTLTLASSATPLREQLDRLTQCFRRLRNTKLWKAACHGGAAAIEITFNRTRQQWHPHLHVIVSGTYIAQYDLREEWKRITGDSFIVDVRLIRDGAATASYVAKYAAKSLNTDTIDTDATLADAIAATSGKRLVMTFGDWKSVKLTNPTAPSEWERLDTYEWIVRQAARGSNEANVVLNHLRFGAAVPHFAQNLREEEAASDTS